MLLWVLFYVVMLFIPLFFFACYTTPRRTSFHSTFWTYLPFCASYKCLGCLSLSFTSHLRRLCLSTGLQVTVPLLLAGKGFIWNARSAEKEWQEKSLLLPLLPEANAQSKTKQSTTQQQQNLRPDRRSQQSSAEQTLSHTPALAAAYNADDWGVLARDQTTRWRRDVNTLELAVGWGWQSDDDADADVGLWAAASTTCVRLTGWPNCGAPWENPKIIVAHVEALG